MFLMRRGDKCTRINTLVQVHTSVYRVLQCVLYIYIYIYILLSKIYSYQFYNFKQ